MTLKETVEIAEKYGLIVKKSEFSTEIRLTYDLHRYGILLTGRKKRIHSLFLDVYEIPLKDLSKEKFIVSLQNFIVLIKKLRINQMMTEITYDFR